MQELGNREQGGFNKNLRRARGQINSKNKMSQIFLNQLRKKKKYLK